MASRRLQPPGEPPWAGRHYSILEPRPDRPPFEVEAGPLQGDRPLDPPDPRYADYFLELKKRIEANWRYPAEAMRCQQSGRGVIHFVLRRDGGVREVTVVSSTGVPILDRYIENAILFASFPPLPQSVTEDALPISLNFSYILNPRSPGLERTR